MKINYNNRDLKVEHNYAHSCSSCALDSSNNILWCKFCSSGKMWIEDKFNSDIFRL